MGVKLRHDGARGALEMGEAAGPEDFVEFGASPRLVAPGRKSLRPCLHVVLDRKRAFPNRQRLHRARPRAREHLGLERRPNDLRPVPLKAGPTARQKSSRAAGFGKRDVEDSDLWGLGGRDVASKGRGQQLVAQAHPEEGGAAFHERADKTQLRPEPGVRGLFPHLHGAAHRPHRVVGLRRGKLLAAIQTDRVPLVPPGLEQVPEEPRVTAVHVLENQNAQRYSRRSRGVRVTPTMP